MMVGPCHYGKEAMCTVLWLILKESFKTQILKIRFQNKKIILLYDLKMSFPTNQVTLKAAKKWSSYKQTRKKIWKSSFRVKILLHGVVIVFSWFQVLEKMSFIFDVYQDNMNPDLSVLLHCVSVLVPPGLTLLKRRLLPGVPGSLIHPVLTFGKIIWV